MRFFNINDQHVGTCRMIEMLLKKNKKIVFICFKAYFLLSYDSKRHFMVLNWSLYEYIDNDIGNYRN